MDARDLLNDLPRCPATSKVCWPSRKYAKQAANQTHGLRLNSFLCRACGAWHIGHAKKFAERKAREDDLRARRARKDQSRKSKPGTRYIPPRQVRGEGWGWSFSTGMVRHLWADNGPVCGAAHSTRPSFYYEADCPPHSTDCPDCAASRES